MIHPAGRERHMQAGMHTGGKRKKVEDKITGSLGKSHEKNQTLLDENGKPETWMVTDRQDTSLDTESREVI